MKFVILCAFALTLSGVSGPLYAESPPLVVQWGLPGDIPLPVTVDAGEGVASLTVFRPATGTWFIQRSRGRTMVIQWGLPGDQPLVGDFDGDRRTDLAVYRPSTGTWFILLSSKAYAVAAARIVQWGLPDDIPVPGDYDGDRVTRIAVFRPSTGMWLIRGRGDLTD